MRRENQEQTGFLSIKQKLTMMWMSAQQPDQLTFNFFRQSRHVMSKNGCVNGLQVGVAGKLDLIGIKERHKTGVQHVPGTPRWAHGPNKLDVFHVLPVQLLPTVIEALQPTCHVSCTVHLHCYVMQHSLSCKLPTLACFCFGQWQSWPCYMWADD